MTFNGISSHRQALHLSAYDYRQEGYYYITICTAQRQHFFGAVHDGKMQYNTAGEQAQRVWQSLPQRFAGIKLDVFTFMPNHMHGILIFTHPPIRIPSTPNIEQVPERFQASMQTRANEKTQNQKEVSLGEIIRTFKGATTRHVRTLGLTRFGWQERLYERVIRNEQELLQVRQYILNNPLKWHQDKFYS